MQLLKFKLSLLGLFISMACLHAQYANSVVTDGTWQVKSVGTLTLTPSTWATLNSGTFSNATVLSSVPCNVNPGTMPGSILAGMTSGSCLLGGGCRVYRKTFTINTSGTLCEAILSVRADDMFRVYMNGSLVSDNLSLFCNGGTFTELNGNDWSQVYNIDVSGFYNVNASNTIIIEVFNCGNGTYAPNVNYLSARLTARSNLPSSVAAFNSTIQGSSGGSSNVTFNSTTTNVRNITNSLWQIEQGTSANGPWNIIQSVPTTNLSFSATLSNCTYYRVTRVVTNGCSDASYSVVFYYCPPGMGNPGSEGYMTLEQEKTEAETEAIIKAAGITTKSVAEEQPSADLASAYAPWQEAEERTDLNTTTSEKWVVSPNPASDFITLNLPTSVLEGIEVAVYDNLGRNTGVTYHANDNGYIYFHSLNNGVYHIQARTVDGQTYHSTVVIQK